MILADKTTYIGRQRARTEPTRRDALVLRGFDALPMAVACCPDLSGRLSPYMGENRPD